MTHSKCSILRFVLVTLLSIAMASCIIVREAPNNDDDDNTVVNGNNSGEYKFNDIPFDAEVVDALIVVDLSRGASGLMNGYYNYIDTVRGVLALRGVYIRKLAFAPLYRQQSHVPPLLYGEGDANNPTQSLSQTLLYYISDEGLAHLDERVDNPAENLAALGLNLGHEPIFNPEGTDGESRSYFDPPEDGFVVFHLTGTDRDCAHADSDCAINGQTPAQYFTETNSSGHASWLNLPGGSGLAPEDIIHISIATEEGVSYDDFVDNCTSEPNFPNAYLDYLAPSAHNYYGSFAHQIEERGGAARTIDLCIAFSDRLITSANSTANSIVNIAR